MRKLSRHGKLALILLVLIIINIVLGIILLARSCSSDNGEVPPTEEVASDAVEDEVEIIDVVEADSLLEEEGEVGYTENEVEVSEKVTSKLFDSHKNKTQGTVSNSKYYNYLENLMFKSSDRKLYGVSLGGRELRDGKIESGETLSLLLNNKFNVNIVVVNKLVEASHGVFDLREMRVGNKYTAFLNKETSELDYLVYEKNSVEYVIFKTSGEPSITLGKKTVTTEECYAEAVINSSLYATIYDEGLSPMLAARLDEIFKWSIDFFSIQEGDSFRVVYEERFIDTTRIGIGKIFGAEFTHRGVPYLAINFVQGDEDGYWDGEGKNLRKNFLRTPLSFSARVSSTYGTRIHPIQGYRKQHNGIDYAAPTGTPVHAVADGTVTARYWERGGGNVVKIKHTHGLETLYMHLSRFGKISVGSRVKQSQVIGYVGTTGMSTGPHLHYGVKEHGRYINPLNVPSTPTTPISSANKERFSTMKADVLSVMNEYQSSHK